MKLARPFLAIALLVCAVAAPAYAQQPQSTSGAEQDPRGRTDRRSAVAGRFAIDVAGHTAGFVDKVEGEEQTPPPTLQNPRAAAVAARPLVVVRPGAIIVAPTTDDKDGDDD